MKEMTKTWVDTSKNIAKFGNNSNGLDLLQVYTHTQWIKSLLSLTK